MPDGLAGFALAVQSSAAERGSKAELLGGAIPGCAVKSSIGIDLTGSRRFPFSVAAGVPDSLPQDRSPRVRAKREQALPCRGDDFSRPFAQQGAQTLRDARLRGRRRSRASSRGARGERLHTRRAQRPGGANGPPRGIPGRRPALPETARSWTREGACSGECSQACWWDRQPVVRGADRGGPGPVESAGLKQLLPSTGSMWIG